MDDDVKRPGDDVEWIFTRTRALDAILPLHRLTFTVSSEIFFDGVQFFYRGAHGFRIRRCALAKSVCQDTAEVD